MHNGQEEVDLSGYSSFCRYHPFEESQFMEKSPKDYLELLLQVTVAES